MRLFFFWVRRAISSLPSVTLVGRYDEEATSPLIVGLCTRRSGLQSLQVEAKRIHLSTNTEIT